MAATPILGGIQLQLVQTVEVDEREVLAEHSVPGLEGDFLQRLGRRATRVEVRGVLLGTQVRPAMEKLRAQFRAAEPVSFVADIATATKVGQVLIEELGVREVAGAPERYAYAFALREYLAPAAQSNQPATPPPSAPAAPPPADAGTLVVAAKVAGQPNFDFSRTTVTAQGTTSEGTTVARTLSHNSSNIWTEARVPPGHVTVVLAEPAVGGGVAAGSVRASQTTRLTITLAPEVVVARAFTVHFSVDCSFVEPAMLQVLRRAGDYATEHPAERLVIVGHSDHAGSAGYIQSLSERRARAVYAAITGDIGEWTALRAAARDPEDARGSWGTREYQLMLQALGFYRGNADGLNGAKTAAAVADFCASNNLRPSSVVDEVVWSAMIRDYLRRGAPAIPADRVLADSAGRPLRWLAHGDSARVRNTECAWRPNRCVELLFVPAGMTPEELTDAAGNALPTQPAEPGNVVLAGSLTFADGSPAAIRYVVTAPDGEYMDGEVAAGPSRGLPVHGATGADGRFCYPANPKGVGVYALAVHGPFLAHNAGEPASSATGNEVARHLDGSSAFDVILTPDR
jgi:outer membrane protein OmpA-like peptidoglycan-associated protein/peptidoglycan hydrolase-like protein with peptidoglycan-binding domain